MMRVARILVAVALATPGYARAGDAAEQGERFFEYTSMSLNEQMAFEDVATSCMADASILCDHPFMPSSVWNHLSFLMDPWSPSTGGAGAPALAAPSSRSLSRPVFSDDDGAGRQGDSVFGFFLQVPVYVVEFTSFVLDCGPTTSAAVGSAPSAGEAGAFSDPSPAEDAIGDGRGAQLVSEPLSEERTDLVAVQRRRLSEVGPAEKQPTSPYHPGLLLPFGSDRINQCMQQAYRDHLVSVPCGVAMQNLEHVRAVEYWTNVGRVQQQFDVFSRLFFLYGLVFCTMLVIYLRHSRDFREQRLLRSRILRAVYADPTIKAAVEVELGHSVGSVPPVPLGALRRIGRDSHLFRRLLRKARQTRLVLYLAACVLMIYAPMTFLSLCVVAAAALCGVATCGPAPVRQCTCCCCGTSTEDAKTGKASQGCCSCCQGTGICNVNCASCCGTGAGDDEEEDDDAKICAGCGSGPENGDDEENGQGCNCCGGSGCACCAAPGTSGQAGCCGCCCAKDGQGGGCGAQGCCCCSSPTPSPSGQGGCCCSSSPSPSPSSPSAGAGQGCCCAGCCTGGGCCCGGAGEKPAKPVLAPQQVVYEGIPVQIV